MKGNNNSNVVVNRISACIIFLLWFAMIFTLLTQRKSTTSDNIDESKRFGKHLMEDLKSNLIKVSPFSSTTHNNNRPIRARSTLMLPKRYTIPEKINEPPSLEEISQNMTIYLHELHAQLEAISGPKVQPLHVWETFLNVTKKLPMVWDEENRYRWPISRQDKTIFVALGTYRDPYCPMTMKSLYSQAKHPERLYVSLFQQNCFGPKCRTGVLVGGRVDDAGPDDDCYQLFCASTEGIHSNACHTGQIRLYNVNESESLGPYMARYLGAKFYRGEQYYLQIDSHSEFVENWDEKLIEMLENAPAKKPIISAYPPDSNMNWRNTPGATMCDSGFADDPIEFHIIRLAATEQPRIAPKIATYAPFVAAGFLFAPATMLKEVPFDPFLPWIFMGEEISMSARLWTAGYDIFSPTINVLNHYYVRRHYPKFWESVNRFFKRPIHNDLSELVIRRVKTMLEYPESTPSAISPTSLLYRLDDWSLGKNRSFNAYMKMVNIDTINKKHPAKNTWCHEGYWPAQALQYKINK